MTTTLKPLTMRPGTVCPAYLFGAEVKAADGRVLASFGTHGQAFRALAVAEQRGMFSDWMASMSTEDMQKVKAVNAYLAGCTEYEA
ncbi:hypothetical protein [Ideonella sp. B508-1]|uniref:hypothetical protein n=1 Tax=Ideonella sp. B508-1 TaxID=137716 RepID=UPI00034A3281|nr:hypothetical protein [Ideonella sp. B508-1]